jgi:hypothetical protein
MRFRIEISSFPMLPHTSHFASAEEFGSSTSAAKTGKNSSSAYLKKKSDEVAETQPRTLED